MNFFVIPAQTGIQIIAEARNLKAEFSIESQNILVIGAKVIIRKAATFFVTKMIEI